MTTNTENKRPEPRPDEASMPFFNGAKQHKVMVQRCTSCGTFMWPVKPWCSNCASSDVEWAQVGGKRYQYL
jgi:uncharacterized OB-fold protein